MAVTRVKGFNLSNSYFIDFPNIVMIYFMPAASSSFL